MSNYKNEQILKLKTATNLTQHKISTYLLLFLPNTSIDYILSDLSIYYYDFIS